jgi:hypothetical protein
MFEGSNAKLRHGRVLDLKVQRYLNDFRNREPRFRVPSRNIMVRMCPGNCGSVGTMFMLTE